MFMYRPSKRPPMPPLHASTLASDNLTPHKVRILGQGEGTRSYCLA